MTLDDKTIKGLASQLGISPDKQNAEAKIRAYEKKSDEELVGELLNLQRKLAASGISYDKQMAAIESLMPMMNEQQKTRLTKVIGLLKK